MSVMQTIDDRMKAWRDGTEPAGKLSELMPETVKYLRRIRVPLCPHDYSGFCLVTRRLTSECADGMEASNGSDA